MDTPRNKRTYDALSPVSDTEFQEEKRQAIEPIHASSNRGNSVVLLSNSSGREQTVPKHNMSNLNYTSVLQQLVDNSDIAFKEAPEWGKAINTNIKTLAKEAEDHSQILLTTSNTANDALTRVEQLEVKMEGLYT